MNFYGNRGLKNCMSKYKGASLIHKLEWLLYEIRLAWQRAWYGYSTSDILNFDQNMSEQLAAMLRTFKENPPFVLINEDTNEFMSDEDAEKLYSRIIKCIEYGNDDELCYEELYSISYYDDDFDANKIVKAYELMLEYKKEAFELLEKYWYQLWY